MTYEEAKEKLEDTTLRISSSIKYGHAFSSRFSHKSQINSIHLRDDDNG